MKTNRNTSRDAVSNRTDRPAPRSANRATRRARIAGRVAAVTLVAGAAFGVASTGPFASEASAWCGSGGPSLPQFCLPDLGNIPMPDGPIIIDGDPIPDPTFPEKVDIPEGGGKNLDPFPLDDEPEEQDPGAEVPPEIIKPDGPIGDQPVFDPSDPIADPLGDPDVPGPGEIAPENPGQAGGEDGDCGIDGTCPDVTVPTTTTVVEPPAEVRGETAVPVGELAFTGSGDTLVRLGAVLAIGGVAAVASAAAARKHRED